MLSATYRVSNDNPRSFPAALPTKQARRRDHPNGKIQAPRAQPLAPSSCFAVQLPRSPSRVQRRPASARGPFPFARQLPPNHPNLLRSTLSTGGTLFHLPRPSAPARRQARSSLPYNDAIARGRSPTPFESAVCPDLASPLVPAEVRLFRVGWLGSRSRRAPPAQRSSSALPVAQSRIHRWRDHFCPLLHTLGRASAARTNPWSELANNVKEV